MSQVGARHLRVEVRASAGQRGAALARRARRWRSESARRAELDAALAAANAEQEIPAHTRRKPTGRKPLPEHLPRVEIEVLPPEVRKHGLDAFERIGEDVCETVERRPASLVVARVIRPKFVRKDRERDARDGGLRRRAAGVAHPSRSRGARHARRHDRQAMAGPHAAAIASKISTRATDSSSHARRSADGTGRSPSSSTPLVAAMRVDAFEQPYLCVDATGVLVQQKERCRTGHFWVLVAPGRHVLFEFTRDHSSDAVDDVLAGYQGFLVADAHVGLRPSLRDRRRRRSELLGARAPVLLQGDRVRPRAREGRARLHRRAVPDRADARRLAAQEARDDPRTSARDPIVDAFFSWCDAEADKVLDDTPIADGIRYARNQRVGLSRFLEDGRLPIHNNMSELALRREAVGRNYAGLVVMRGPPDNQRRRPDGRGTRASPGRRIITGRPRTREARRMARGAECGNGAP